QARRQPGSAFKPFVYATAFEVGFTPASIFDDSPVSYPTIIAGEPIEWAPENYDKKFRGPVTLRQGLEKSINVIAVKLIEQVGVKPVIRLAHRLGIQSHLRPEFGLALGASEVSLLEMVSAYGVFAAGGYRVEPYTIKRVLDSRGAVLEESFPVPRLVLRPETAFVLTHVLEGVVQRGTGKRAKVLERPVAAKTGTTDKATDVWFIGYTPSLAAGVWIGYDIKRSLGRYATSAHLAVPIWIDFMRVILDGTPVKDFPVPQGVAPMYVDYRTGQPTTADDPNVIQEYFIAGTEPQHHAPSMPLPNLSSSGLPISLQPQGAVYGCESTTNSAVIEGRCALQTMLKTPALSALKFTRVTFGGRTFLCWKRSSAPDSPSWGGSRGTWGFGPQAAGVRRHRPGPHEQYI
ncbi:MAG: penicillin-binding transpeptidase domain-containing protein, partial [Candidatus Methylomirabilales bacterium]